MIQNYEKPVYYQGWRMGFYTGLAVMGAFAIFVFILTFFGGRCS